MPLIICPDCAQSISDTTAMCIHCGYQPRTPPPVTTIEATSKTWKGVQLIGLVGFAVCVGISTSFSDAPVDGPMKGLFGLMGGGFGLLFLCSRLMAWWDHG
jgi:hypothetical protein